MRLRALIVLFAALPLAAQPPDASAPNPATPVDTIHTTARIVVLDVVVTDGHGHPVPNLTQKDFTLTEDGVPQTIRSFSEHDAIRTPPPPDPFADQPNLPPNTFLTRPPVPAGGARSVIVLGNLAFADAPFVRDQIKAYLKSITSTMPIALVRLDWQGLHLIQDFTSDPRALLEAASSKRMLPPLGFPPRGAVFTRGSLQLTTYLEGMPGRINLIWFGSGVGPHQKFPDVATFVRDLNGARAVLRLSEVALFTIDAGGLSTQAVSIGGATGTGFDTAAQAALANSPGFATDFGAGIFDTGGGSAVGRTTAGSIPGLFSSPDPGHAFAHQDLQDLATSTGGRAFYNTNGFKEIIAEVMDTGAHYYTISYTPTNPNWNGGYRAIHMTVAGPAPPPYNPSLYDRVLGWTSDSPRLEYRRGYNANPLMESPGPAIASASADSTPTNPNRRKLVSQPVTPEPTFLTPAQIAANETEIRQAMAFASPTPTQIPFAITVTPPHEIDKLHPADALPKGNFLAAEFRTQPFRNYKLHYSIPAQNFNFATADGAFQDSFQFVAVLYRDDGAVINSIQHTVPIRADIFQRDQIARTGIGFDQTIAVPTTGNFYLRVAVHETTSGHVGTIQVPTESIKLQPTQTIAKSQ